MIGVRVVEGGLAVAPDQRLVDMARAAGMVARLYGVAWQPNPPRGSVWEVV